MLTWVFEAGVFSQDDAFLSAVAEQGHSLVLWSDAWWQSGAFPVLDGPVMFRGSLENAARIATSSNWLPGALCRVEAFCCTAYYPHVTSWLLTERYELTTVELFCQRAKWFAQRFKSTQLFVRPNSPLKPFSGRIVDTETVIPQSMDCGFYYDDTSLPIVVSEVQEVLAEWRCVVVGEVVIAHSGYNANRAATHLTMPPAAMALVETIARQIDMPDFAYVMDICQTSMGYCLVELNPFSGADLYGCDVSRVVAAIEDCIRDHRCFDV